MVTGYVRIMLKPAASPLGTFLAPARPGKGDTAQSTIDNILDAVRAHLGMEIAYAAKWIDGGLRELTHVSTDLDLPMGPGFQDAQEEGYCYHVLHGRLPQLIIDPADYPITHDMAITKALPVGSHLNVPLRLSDGTVYGSFCCLSRVPDRSLTERDLDVVRAFADLATVEIESQIAADRRHSALREKIVAQLARNTLTIVHQPIHSLATGSPIGVECLARFPDSAERGPDHWFVEAAEVGLGVELEMLAVRAAFATLPFVPLGHYAAINVSPETVLSGALEEVISSALPARLVIEVTEHNRVHDYATLRTALNRIRPFARIAIDDVGAGYSGLRHIVDLEPDVLKLDMSLTRHIDRDSARRALAQAMVVFARDIGCTLVAEGVETLEERDCLAELGVQSAQGYFYSPPMPVVASQQMLLGRREYVAPDSQEAPALSVPVQNRVRSA